MVAGAQGDTPGVLGWYLNILRDIFSDSSTVSTRCRVLSLAKS